MSLRIANSEKEMIRLVYLSISFILKPAFDGQWFRTISIYLVTFFLVKVVFSNSGF